MSHVERQDGYIRAAVPPEQAAQLNQTLASREIFLSELTPWEMDLEKVFLELTGEPMEETPA